MKAVAFQTHLFAYKHLHNCVARFGSIGSVRRECSTETKTMSIAGTKQPGRPNNLRLKTSYSLFIAYFKIVGRLNFKAHLFKLASKKIWHFCTF